MIFQHTWQRVLDGSKTQTRRLCGESVVVKDQVALDQRSGRILWATDRTYAVQPGRGKRAVGRIRITFLRVEPLQWITWYGARAEGFTDVGEFRAVWDSIHGHMRGCRWEDNPSVCVIMFEAVQS